MYHVNTVDATLNRTFVNVSPTGRVLNAIHTWVLAIIVPQLVVRVRMDQILVFVNLAILDLNVRPGNVTGVAMGRVRLLMDSNIVYATKVSECVYHLNHKIK